MYFDILRIISTALIVMVHVIAMTWYVSDVNSFRWKVYAIFKCTGFQAVSVFTMISGALFLGDSKKSIKRIYTHNVRKLLFAYFFWSAVYALVLGLKYRSA